MELSPYLVPGAATMAVLAIVYLVFVFWTRRPGRAIDVARRDSDSDTIDDAQVR